MKVILSISLVFAVLIQFIQAFCVYNELTDGSNIDVQQIKMADETKAFKKSIAPGNKECCHFSNRECSRMGISDDPTLFLVKFYFPRYTTFNYRGSCYTGGALVLRGDASHYWADCVDQVGEQKTVKLEPAGSWPYTKKKRGLKYNKKK